ncbi:MAG: insulinase family protein [Firmicutes bacterium]|nr:insulinase family protein [Bacillota bacterium]
MATVLHRRLQNGISVFIHPTEKFKTILVQLFFHRQLRQEDVTQSALLPAVLQRGTVRYPSRRQLVLHLEKLYGAELTADIVKKGECQLVVYTLDLVHDQYLPGENRLLRDGLQILHELLTNPVLENGAFKEEYVRQEKEQHEKVIKGLINDKIAYAIERCLQEMCRDEPFSVFKYGTLEKLREIDAASLYGFYRSFLRESPAELHLIGDLDPERTFALVQDIFRFARGTGAELPPTQVHIPVEGVRYVTEELDVNQGKLVLGFRTGLTYANADYFALLLYNGILGGFPHSKLFQNVREKASLAYYAYSRLEKHKGLMLISSGIEFKNYEKTLDIIRKQVADMAAGNFSKEDFDNTYSGLRNQFLLEEDNPAALINRTVDGMLAGKVRTTADLLNKLRSVTRDDVVRIAGQVKLDTVYFMTRRGARK